MTTFKQSEQYNAYTNRLHVVAGLFVVAAVVSLIFLPDRFEFDQDMIVRLVTYAVIGGLTLVYWLRRRAKTSDRSKWTHGRELI
ncbi:MAG: hypothetical protein MPJ78_01510 [Hyphomicrobiaceae bacterium]|nr:hypothetical protein [Hyphomicrobiaceae bacterium]